MSRQLKEVPARSYLSTAPFHLNFFTYTTSMDRSTFKKSGDLSAVSGATSSNCPAGRVLRENGRKLYPGAHDISTVNGVATTFPSGTVMVGVFDNQSGLNGFIDPNAPMFAVYNGDRAGYLKDAVDPVGGLTDQGAPVKTNGQLATRVVALGTLAAAGVSTLDTSLGNLFTLTLPASGTNTMGVNTTTLVAGTVVRLLISGGAGTLTFGDGFKKQQVSPVVASVLTLASGTISFVFVSDGSNLWELSRTVALT
jgi:hypothetical protein